MINQPGAGIKEKNATADRLPNKRKNYLLHSIK